MSDDDTAGLVVRLSTEMGKYDPDTLGDNPHEFDSWNLLFDVKAALESRPLAPVQVPQESNEQARIAKLIALMGAEFDRPRFGLPRGSRRDSDYLEVVAEIRKGLGL